LSSRTRRCRRLRSPISATPKVTAPPLGPSHLPRSLVHLLTPWLSWFHSRSTPSLSFRSIAPPEDLQPPSSAGPGSNWHHGSNTRGRRAVLKPVIPFPSSRTTCNLAGASHLRASPAILVGTLIPNRWALLF
jgi:hypothetical protein